jgi:hypothetical protein
MRVQITGEQYNELKKAGLGHFLIKEEQFFVDTHNAQTNVLDAPKPKQKRIGALTVVRLAKDWDEKQDTMRQARSRRNAHSVATILGKDYMARGELGEKLMAKTGKPSSICSGIVSAMIRQGILEVWSA